MNYKSLRRRDRIAELIKEGVVLQKDIAMELGCTRQNVSAVIHRCGWLEKLWEDHKNYSQASLEGVFESLGKYSRFLIAQNLDSEKDWAAEKTARVFLAMSGKNFRKYKERGFLEEIYSIFDKYRNAEMNGKKLSLAQLGDGKLPADVGRYLKFAGVAPMYGNISRNVIPIETRELIFRAKDLDWSYPDIAHFIGVESYNVYNWLKGRNVKRIRHRNIGSKRVTLAVSSMIYEAEDEGFKKFEITDVVGTSLDVVNYVSRSKSIRKNIIKGLEQIYEMKFDKPYR